MKQPEPEMLALADGIARFIAGEPLPDDVFDTDVTIIENFAPHIFRSVAVWHDAMRAHTATLADMRYAFSDALDFTHHGDSAFFCLPVTWQGTLHGRPFRELGGKSLVLRRTEQGWRVAAYAWAVMEMRYL